ncbi:MAG: ubiquinol-cytochrome c reductase iron-sulfur subunit [Salinigranum sp.]
MSESDKYPEDSGRRRFVKGVVGGAALAGVGTAAAGTINTATTSPGKGGGTTQDYAIENIDGPAPRGMPIIPLEITSDGYLKGAWPKVQKVTENGVQTTIAKTENYKGAGITFSSTWYQYCGLQTYKQIRPGYDGDLFLRSDASPAYQWQKDEYSKGDKLHVDSFKDYKSWGNGIGKSGLGKPATGTWRSQDVQDTLPIQVIKSKFIYEAAKKSKVVDALTQDGFVAWLDKCTHFCCVPGFKQTSTSAKFDAQNHVYCPCHQSVYDPFSIVSNLFTALPIPEK